MADVRSWMSTQEIALNFTHEDFPLFPEFYPHLAFAMEQGNLSVAYGTREHMQKTWLWSIRALPLRRKAMAKHGRWHNVMCKTKEQMPYLPCIGMTGMYMGIIENWACNHPPALIDYRTAPETENTEDDEDERPVLAVDVAEGSERDVAGSNTWADNFVSKKCKNKLHLVTNISMNVAAAELWSLLLAVTEPVIDQHGADQRQMATKRG